MVIQTPPFNTDRYAAEIAAAKQVKGTPETARKALQALDLTTLQDNATRKGTETKAEIAAFLETATESVDGSKIAAVCVYPNHVRQAADATRGTGIGVATVVNFYDGDEPAQKVAADTRMAKKAGATEIDVVIPFKTFTDRYDEQTGDVLSATRKAAPLQKMKVILETNQLQDTTKIYEASIAAITAGADMLKTSTGKNDGDVTLEHAAAMLAAIKDTGMNIGLKISKGVKTKEQAAQFMALADSIMGEGWSADRDNFRFGASSLRTDLVANMDLPAAKRPAAAPESKPGMNGDY